MKACRLTGKSLLPAACLLMVSLPLSAQQPCGNLINQKLPNVTIATAVFLDDPLGFLPPITPGVFGTPRDLKVSKPFCRVIGSIEPAPDSHIGFEVWLPPPENWNGRYLMVGNPAFEGAIKYGSMAGPLANGYATASTDTGHQAPGHKWALGHPEMLVDWAHRSTHETTVAARHLIEAFYGKPPSYSYFDGCHNGGRQGLAEAQRYPEDFDGILSADPAFHLTHLQPGSEYLSWVALKNGVESPGYIPPGKYPMLNRAVLDACDELDGVKDDAIEDPARCHFDPISIQCPGPDRDSCLTPAQVETARRLYAGAKFADGTQIYSGFEPGSELLWGAMIEGPEPLFINNDFFKYLAFEDPEWDWRTFDLEVDTRRTDENLAHIINSTGTDLSDFKAAGGKIIVYQSWNETWVPPRTITVYHDDVQETMGGPGETRDFFRLFVVPDAPMCPGSNPAAFDIMGALQRWVEEGTAPDQVTMSYSDRGRVYKTHPVCVYPEAAIYRGEGDINDASSFTCGSPAW